MLLYAWPLLDAQTVVGKPDASAPEQSLLGAVVVERLGACLSHPAATSSTLDASTVGPSVVGGAAGAGARASTSSPRDGDERA